MTNLNSNNKPLSINQVLKAVQNNLSVLSNAQYTIKERNPAIKYSKTQYMIDIPNVRRLYTSKQAFYQIKTLLDSLQLSNEKLNALTLEVTTLQQECLSLKEKTSAQEAELETLKECQEASDIITSKLREMLTLQGKLFRATKDENWGVVSICATALANAETEIDEWEAYILNIQS